MSLSLSVHTLASQNRSVHDVYVSLTRRAKRLRPHTLSAEADSLQSLSKTILITTQPRKTVHFTFK